MMDSWGISHQCPNIATVSAGEKTIIKFIWIHMQDLNKICLNRKEALSKAHCKKRKTQKSKLRETLVPLPLVVAWREVSGAVPSPSAPEKMKRIQALTNTLLLRIEKQKGKCNKFAVTPLPCSDFQGHNERKAVSPGFHFQLCPQVGKNKKRHVHC